MLKTIRVARDVNRSLKNDLKKYLSASHSLHTDQLNIRNHPQRSENTISHEHNPPGVTVEVSI